MSTERPGDDAPVEAWQRYVLERVAPLIAERDAAFREQAEPLSVVTAPRTTLVRALLALASAAAVSTEGLPDILKAAFAPDPLPWPLWIGRPRRAERDDDSAYFAPPEWEGRCGLIYLRERERRRLEAQGLDFATVEREKNRGGDDVQAIMAQAGLGSLGSGVVLLVVAKPEAEEP